MTFGSVYEILNPLTEIRKQRFWDWFDGDALRSWWTEDTFLGSVSYAMNDAVDGGIKITANSGGSQARGQIDFNQIRHYSETNCVGIWIAKNIPTADGAYVLGFCNIHYAAIDNARHDNDHNTTTTFQRLLVKRVGDIIVDTSLVTDEAEHVIKMEMTSSNVTLKIENILEATVSTGLPINPMQPFCGVINELSTSTHECLYRYCEAFST